MSLEQILECVAPFVPVQPLHEAFEGMGMGHGKHHCRESGRRPATLLKRRPDVFKGLRLLARHIHAKANRRCVERYGFADRADVSGIWRGSDRAVTANASQDR